MDPLYIASGAAGIAVTALKVSTTLYTFFDDVRNVDTSVADLIQEIRGLSAVLDAISQLWTQNPTFVATQAQSHGNLWSSVRSSLDDCRRTLEKLEKTLDDVQKGSLLGSGFFRKPAKQIKLNFYMKELLTYKQSINWHNSAMQSAFQLINVCLALQSNTSQDHVKQSLANLKTQIGRVQVAVQRRSGREESSGGLTDDDNRVARNLRQLARAADTFHSNASTILADADRSTIWGGSVMGDALNDEQFANIRDWIPSPTITEQSNSDQSPSRLDTSLAGPSTTTDVDFQEDCSTDDSDIESELTKRFEQLAMRNLEKKEYGKGEAFLRKAIDRREVDSNSLKQAQTIDLILAFVYGAQAKWEEAEKIILPIATARKPTDAVIFTGLKALAIISFEQGNFEVASQQCKRVVWGYSRTFGRKSKDYLESMALLAHIYRKKGDETEAEVCESFLPEDFLFTFPSEPVDYCRALFADNIPFEKPATLPKYNSSKATNLSSINELSVPSAEPPGNTPGNPAWKVRDLLSPSQPLTSETSEPLTSRRSLQIQQSSSGKEEYHIAEDRNRYYPRESTVHTHNHQPRPSPIDSSLVRLIVGIDFGLDFASVAYASVNITANAVDAREDLIVQWPGSGNTTAPKVPSVIYHKDDDSRKIVGWGFDVAEALAPTGHPKPDLVKAEWFKLRLAADFANNAEYLIKLPPLPRGMSAIDVVADFLLLLRTAIHHHLESNLGDIYTTQQTTIEYCFTINPTWDEASISNLRSSNLKAGYVEDTKDARLILLPVPVAISAWSCRSGALSLEERDIFVTVDGDGTTCRVFALKLTSLVHLTFSEHSPPMEDNCGPTAILRNFSIMMRSKIRKMRLPDYSRIAAHVYAKCLLDFKNRIKQEFKNNQQKWAVDIGIKMNFTEISIADGYMVFTNDEILACFTPVVDRILEMIRLQIIAVEQTESQLKMINVTGEIGTLEYLFQAILLTFHEQVVVRPMNSEAAKVRGAVAACLSRVKEPAPTPGLISVNRPGIHRGSYRVSSIDGLDQCILTAELVWPEIRSIVPRNNQAIIRIEMTKILKPGESLVLTDTIYRCISAGRPQLKYGNISSYQTDIPEWMDMHSCPKLTQEELDYPIYLDDPDISAELRAIIRTDLSQKQPDVDFRKFRMPQGVFYIIEYELVVTFDSASNDTVHPVAVDSIYNGEVVTRSYVPYG